MLGKGGPGVSSCTGYGNEARSWSRPLDAALPRPRLERPMSERAHSYKKGGYGGKGRAGIGDVFLEKLGSHAQRRDLEKGLARRDSLA